MKPRIRPATPADVAALVAIEQQVFESDRLSPRSLKRHVASPTADMPVAIAGGEPVAYALVLYREGSDAARLYSIAASPAARGLGLGRRLMATCEQAAVRRGRTRLRLEVRIDNKPAIRLYEALGYRAIARVADYYEDGATALRYEKRLKSS